MIEILLLRWLCQKMAAILRGKGRRSGWYCTMLVVFWFLGEMVGGIAGVVAFDRNDGRMNAVAYLTALVGATLGALGAFWIVKSLSPLGVTPTGGFPVIQRPVVIDAAANNESIAGKIQ